MTGKYGTISHLIKEFKIPKTKRQQVMSVLREVYTYKITEHTYNDRTYWRNEGASFLIKSGSTEKLIITEWMEQRLRFRKTALIVN